MAPTWAVPGLFASTYDKIGTTLARSSLNGL